MSRLPDPDIFGLGRDASALARAAFGGRGFFTAVRRQLADGSWVGPPNAADLATLDWVRVPYALAEPEEERRQRLALLPQAPCALVPVPVGEPQGLDTLGFFAACRLARPKAHVIVDLELLGHKLGQLCLSFGADGLMGSIVAQRELRLGARVSSKELTREEAGRMLEAAGLQACEQGTLAEAGA